LPRIVVKTPVIGRQEILIEISTDYGRV